MRETADELGIEPVGRRPRCISLGWIARRRGDLRRSEKLFREAVRMTSGRGDHGLLPDYHAALATTLAELGKIDEAERLALDAAAHAVQEDTSGQVYMVTALALGSRRAGARREAEELFRQRDRPREEVGSAGSSSGIRSSNSSSSSGGGAATTTRASTRRGSPSSLCRSSESTARIA